MRMINDFEICFPMSKEYLFVHLVPMCPSQNFNYFVFILLILIKLKLIIILIYLSLLILNKFSLLDTLFNGADVREILPGPSITSPLNFSSLPFFEIMYGNVNDYAWGAEGLDAVVTQLLNQFEANGPPPMNKTDIDKLPEVKVTEEQVKTSLECTVCMEEFKLDEKVKQLSCQHMFHKDCISPWLEMVKRFTVHNPTNLFF